jgi:hypothetical protein
MAYQEEDSNGRKGSEEDDDMGRARSKGGETREGKVKGEENGEGSGLLNISDKLTPM